MSVQPPPPSPSPASSEQKIAVLEEKVQLVRTTEEVGAVRVRIQSSVRTELASESVIHRGVEVQRVPRDIPVSEASAPWRDGKVLVVPVYIERVVKQLFLVEEIRMTPTEEAREETVGIELRSETPIFERRSADGQWHEIPSPD